MVVLGMITYKDILKDTDPKVREKSRNVKLPLSVEDRNTLLEMLQYIKDSVDEEKSEKYGLRPAVGLAAPQIGVMKKMFAMAILVEEEDGSLSFDEYAFVNPKIVSYSVQRAYLKDGEGCLSVEEEHRGFVPRAARITVKGYDVLQDKEVEIRLRGYKAIVAQHEMDHFNGVLFYDHINKKNPFEEIPNAMVIE